MSAREQDWRKIVVGELLEFSSPVALERTTAEGADTAFSEWQGDGLTVRVDYGLFVDPRRAPSGRVVQRSLARPSTGCRPHG